MSTHLPKNEFVQNLIHLPSSVLRCRLALFNEACNHSLVLPGYVNFPPVRRRDTAIKPVAHILSEDIWTIISCIRSKTTIPTTLFKNCKRSKTFLFQASQRDISISDNATSLPTTSPSEHVSPHSVSSRPDLTHPNPQSSSVANFFISRELYHLKDEIKSMKADIAPPLLMLLSMS